MQKVSHVPNVMLLLRDLVQDPYFYPSMLEIFLSLRNCGIKDLGLHAHSEVKQGVPL